MRKQTGFTLIELMVVMAIIGILAVTGVPLYQTYQQRAYGSQANIMMKSLMDAEIMYYLENSNFYPAVGEDIFIPYEGQGTPSPASALGDLDEKLKVKISQSSIFRYTISNSEAYGLGVTIEAPFRLFKDGPSPGLFSAVVTKEGEVTYLGK